MRHYPKADHTIICTPADEWPQHKVAGKWNCSDCRREVWIGVKSFEVMKDLKTKVTVLCRACGLKLIEKRKSDGEKVAVAKPHGEKDWITTEGEIL